MQCSADDREGRLAAQKEAQAKMEEKKAADKVKRLEELAKEKEEAALRAAKKKLLSA